MRTLATKGGSSSESLNRSIKIKAWVNHPVLDEALLISMHLQADVCGALIGSFLALFLTPNPALHNNSPETQTVSELAF